MPRRIGSGIDLAAPLAPAHAAVMRDMLEQLLIVFLKRLGGAAEVPAAEIDDTGQDLLTFRVDPVTRTFHFEVRKKS